MTENPSVPSEYQWCLDEFADVDLQDARLNARCSELAIQMAMQPSLSLNQACEDWAAAKAAYRFFDNEDVTPQRIQAPHHQQTVARMSAHPLVLAIEDTTFLNYTHHPQTEGLGPIGEKRLKQRGFLLHSTLAVLPDGLPLGLLTQEILTRPDNEPSRQAEENRLQPIEEKESYRWLQAFEQILALAPPGVEVVTVCDREADIYEMFIFAHENKAPLLVRAAWNRALLDVDIRRLWPRVTGQPVVGHLAVKIAGNNTRPARETTVSVRFAPVTLRPPWRPPGRKLPPVSLHAIFVREEDPPPDVEEPIEWMLLTNTAMTSFQEAQQVVGWYCCRWQIEVFHKVLKSGCRVENCRLQTAERLHSFVALMSVIAWRLHWATYINRCQPNLPCTAVLSDTEWEALYMRIHKSNRLPDEIPTVRQAIRWIAQLGGFLGRKSDGEPGVTAIWRGWQRLQDMAATWEIVKEQAQLMGNR